MKIINVKFTLFELIFLIFVMYTYKCRIFHNFVLENGILHSKISVERLRLLADEMADPPTWSRLGDFRYKVIELRVVLTVYLIMGGHWIKSMKKEILFTTTKINFVCSPKTTD